MRGAYTRPAAARYSGGLEGGCGTLRVKAHPVDPKALELLYKPLPRDLPTVDKGILILTATWSENVHRYARLRRPRKVSGEEQCVVRGIYHDTFFAKWVAEEKGMYPRFARCCNARFLMNDDISWAPEEGLKEEYLPQLSEAWIPNLPLYSSSWIGSPLGDSTSSLQEN